MSLKAALGLIVLAALLAVGAIYLSLKRTARTLGGMIRLEPVIPSAWIVDNLATSEPGLLMNALVILEKRADPAGMAEAERLLQHDDNRVCFYASLYLASVNYAESVPWLLRALRHPYSEDNPKALRSLERITGQKFGKDQNGWIKWWKAQHADSTFVFSYPNLDRETENLSDRVGLLITAVTDAVTMRHCEPRIRLIGIRPKNGTSDPRAIRLLKTLVLDQFVQLQFDHGPKLDENGARRAFVYWGWLGHGEGDSPYLRRGLPPVPFKAGPSPPRSQKPLINRYLLQSGLYEADLESVHDEDMRKLLVEDLQDAGAK